MFSRLFLIDFRLEYNSVLVQTQSSRQHFDANFGPLSKSKTKFVYDVDMVGR